MPDIDADGCMIHAEVEGPERAPVLMLSNSLGTNLHMWDDQVAPFTRHFRLLRYDRRGHGRSGVPQGPYSMERLGRDVLAVLDKLGIEKINWCGLSMGGMVGQWLGANAPDRVDKLILSNTACYYPDPTFWVERLKFVRANGLPALVGANMERWFTKDFRERAPDVIARMTEMFLKTDIEGYVCCMEAIRDMDHRPLLPKIKAPTLVIAGRFDPATASRQRVHPRPHPRRKARGARCGAYRQHGAAAGLCRHRARVLVERGRGLINTPRSNSCPLVSVCVDRQCFQ
jgi:3-oxoadipate enol-lactonase